jgi:putative intracellular protease/amidase
METFNRRAMKYLMSLMMAVCGNTLAYAQPIPQEPKNVAIFLYQDVELLDFAGPAEVFSAAGFKTYTVSVDGKNLISQRLLEIKPEYSIDHAPIPDILVFPGGNSGPSANDPKVIEWITKLYHNNTQFMSVCTGAFILAKAGLLDNKRVTTHWGSTKELGQKYPTATVMENTRWVDNGFVITTAGVSAGIDGALHFVARIQGIEAANRTARYMEYDKWDAANGVVDVQNSYLLGIVTSGDIKDKTSGNSSRGLHETNAPYIGEFLNLAISLEGKGNVAAATKVIDAGLAIYPNAQELYTLLGKINRKLGKPAPVAESELVSMARNGEVDAVIARVEKDKKAFPKWRIYSENAMKDAAYFLLLEKKDVQGAIKIFTMNTKEFPYSADTFDSLGEALLAAGKKKEGIENYKIAASMGYANAKKVLNELNAE